MKEKILIYGGTFDPVHKGHTHILKSFKEAINPDKILVIPTGDPPHKDSPDLINASHRINMLKLALKEENIDAEISDIEVNSKEKSYTAVTLTKLRAIYPDAEFYFSMGEDMFLTLHKWYKPEIILKEAFICAAKRSDDAEERLKKQYENLKTNFSDFKGEIFNIPYLEASSTEIREGTPDKKRELLSESVFRYIFENSLYTDTFENKIPNREECLKLIKPLLKEKRYTHSLFVAKKALELQLKYGNSNKEKVEAAALLHDIMKDTSIETQLKIIEYSGIILSDSFLKSPQVLHQLSGALYLKNYLKVSSRSIISAVKYHTTGRANMSTTEKIIFVADSTSEERNYENLDIIKEASEISLDKAIFVNTQCILKDFASKGLFIVEDTLKTYNYYLAKVE